MSTSTTYRDAWDAEMGFRLTVPPDEVAARIRYYMGDQVDSKDLPQDVYNALQPILTGPTGKRFGANIIRQPITALNSLLNVDGLRHTDPDTLDIVTAAEQAQRRIAIAEQAGQEPDPALLEAVAKAGPYLDAVDWTWARWKASDGSVMWNHLQTSVAVTGVGYLVCGFGADGLPRVHVNAPQDEERGTGIEPGEVDDEGRLVTATKWYTETRYVDATTGRVVRWLDWLLSTIGINRERQAVRPESWRWRILYEPDRIRRFVTGPNNKEVPADPERDGAEPETAWPYSRIPVVAFTSPVGNEVDAVLPYQQLVNHAMLSLQHLSMVQGFPVTWAIDGDLGASTAAADTSAPSDGRRTEAASSSTPQIAAGPGALLAVDTRHGAPGQAQVTRLEPADLAQQMDAIKLYMGMASWSGGYPVAWLPHNHTSQPPSGEALKSLMQPLLDKAELYQEQHTPQLEAVFGLLQEMGGRQVVGLSPVWRDIDIRDMAAAATRAQVLNDTGLVAPEVVLREAGLDQPDIDASLAWGEKIETARAERVAANVADLIAPTVEPAVDGEEVPSG